MIKLIYDVFVGFWEKALSLDNKPFLNRHGKEGLFFIYF